MVFVMQRGGGGGREPGGIRSGGEGKVFSSAVSELVGGGPSTNDIRTSSQYLGHLPLARTLD